MQTVRGCMQTQSHHVKGGLPCAPGTPPVQLHIRLQASTKASEGQRTVQRVEDKASEIG